jgi:hypothetical protein
LIIRYTKNCPTPEVIDMTSKSAVNYKCSHKYTRNDQPFNVTIAITKVNILAHLFISAIISVGWGLKFTFISACKSGRNPYATKWNNKNTIPINYYFTSLYFVYGSLNWNINIPIAIIKATIIFFGPNFKFSSCTLEQNTPTNTTGNILQD